jgi:two-component system, LytTR family, response regulator
MDANGKRAAALNVLVVDDEELARRNVTLLLRGDPDIGAISECRSGLEAVESIRRSTPDLLFLDVQMPECGGFDVLEMLGGDAPPAVVFVTAHDQYALRAFEAGALDYLMKPFDDARFARALTRAKERLTQASLRGSQPLQRLVVKNKDQVIFVDVTDIDWIDAAGYYACLHVGKDTHILRRSLSDLERDLGDDRFLRIHRSVILNLERVHGLERQAGGEYEVILKSRVRLQLSRRFRKRLLERLDGTAIRD